MHILARRQLDFELVCRAMRHVSTGDVAHRRRAQYASPSSVLHCWHVWHGAVSSHKYLDVPGCTCKQLTRWEEGRFTVSKAAGIQERKKREQETVDKAMSKAEPGAWGCVQVCDPTNLGFKCCGVCV